MLIQKLSLLVLLLQQLVVQLGQQNAQPINFDLGRRASIGSAASNQLSAPKNEAPVITKVEPDKGAVGTIVKIAGSGFEREGNLVYTGAGAIVVASPDGQTLSFTLPAPPFLTSKYLANTASYRQKYYDGQIIFPLGFYVKNSHGVTANPGLFSLTF